MGLTAEGAASWEHSTLTDLAEALGAKHVEDYPDDAFDLIWTLPPKYKKVTSTTSEHCPGLDSWGISLGELEN